MPVAATLTPKAVAAIAAVTTIGALTYTRVVLPYQAERLAEIRRLNGDYHVHVERSGGGI